MKWIGLNETKSDDIDSKEDDIGLKLMDSSIFSVDFAARFYIDYVSDKVPFSGDGKTIYNIKCIQQSKNDTYYLSKNTTKPFKIGCPTSTLFKKIDSQFVLQKNVDKDANKDANNEFYIYDNFDKNKDALTIMDNNLKFLNKSEREHRYIDEKACIFKIFEVGNGKYKIKSVLNDQWLAFNDHSDELIGTNDESNESICFFNFEYHDDNKFENEDLLEPDIDYDCNLENLSNITCILTHRQKQFDRKSIPKEICVEYFSTKTKNKTTKYFDIGQDTCLLPDFSFKDKEINVFYVDENKKRISSIATKKDPHLNRFDAGTLNYTVKTDSVVLTYINAKINNDESDKELVVKFDHDKKYEIQLDKDKKCTIDRDKILFHHTTSVEYYIQFINGDIITKIGKTTIWNPYYSTPSITTASYLNGKITAHFNIDKSKIFETCDLYYRWHNDKSQQFTLITYKPRHFVDSFWNTSKYLVEFEFKPPSFLAFSLSYQIQFELRLKDKRISEIWNSKNTTRTKN